MTLDSFARFCLFFSQTYTLLGIIGIGMLWLDRKLFYQLWILSALCIMVNVALKGTFKVPLPATLHPGYAFPSGHMQLTTVFYGYLMANFENRWLRLSALLVLCAVGFGLMHFHYHNGREVLAGLFFGMILLLGFNFGRKYCAASMPLMIMLIAALLLGYSHVVYPQVPQHLYTAQCVLLIGILGEHVRYGIYKKSSLWVTPNDVAT